MAEVSRRLGVRALRISVLSSAKVYHTAGAVEALATAVSTVPASATHEHEHLTELSEPELRRQPAHRGEQPSLKDFENTVYRRGFTEVYHEHGPDSLSGVSLPRDFTGYYVVFLDERGQSLVICPKQQRSHTQHGHERRSASRGLHSSVRRSHVWADGQLLSARLNCRMHPLHQLRMYRTLAAQTHARSGPLSSLTSLWSVHRWPGARAYGTDDSFRSRTTYYDILQVSPSATQAQIKTAYYKQSFLFHPDKNAGSREATQRFAQISEAYSVLGSKWLRRKYDVGILSQADLRGGGGQAGGRDPTPPRPFSQQRQQQQYRRSNASWGGRHHFDFDEFYRAHYGEQLQREKEAKLRKEALSRQRQEQLKIYRQRRMIEVTMTILVTMATLILISVRES
ncbi:dnaJ (Hsp40) homolog, subfamily C, member 30b [Sardina pilchardus]|uniref:dnaJ (Hsp40) homolog, subfamily C, member 30b n=1 Tax=Sardina pilchardus TaxID=27697 RepID=UPI002E0EDB26